MSMILIELVIGAIEMLNTLGRLILKETSEVVHLICGVS